MDKIKELVKACHWIGAKGWAPATGGNMSVREDQTWCWLSESGKDKGQMTENDFLKVNIQTHEVPSGHTPSAETGLHTLVYRLFEDANVVLHIHTVNATVLSRIEKKPLLVLQGYEMQKALSGQSTHESEIKIPVFDNQQDITALAQEIQKSSAQLSHAFLLRGHGLTCWGKNVQEACRHLETLDYLFECELKFRMWEK